MGWGDGDVMLLIEHINESSQRIRRHVPPSCSHLAGVACYDEHVSFMDVVWWHSSE